MLLYSIAILLCCSLLEHTTAIEDLHRIPLDFSNTPSKNIFLEDNGPRYHAGHQTLKIVNGLPAVRGQFCYQVYLQFSDGQSYWSCGGSLISSSVILTAAHCVKGANSAVAVLGGLDLSVYDEPGRVIVRVPPGGLRAHEKYDSRQIYNDIAVVKLPNPVELSEFICTVKVPSCSSKLSADSDNKNNFTVSGWGKTSDRTTTSHLMYVNVSGEAQKSCASFYKSRANYNIIESQLCTSGIGGKSACNGDSGGPLVQLDSEGSVVQQGAVSLGLRSCQLSAPSVFTDLRYFVDWLCPLLL